MDFSMIAWFSIASLIVLLATVKGIYASVNRLRVSHKAQGCERHVKLFEIGSEREGIWIPGDLPMSRQYDYDAAD